MAGGLGVVLVDCLGDWNFCLTLIIPAPAMRMGRKGLSPLRHFRGTRVFCGQVSCYDKWALYFKREVRAEFCPDGPLG